MTIPKLLAQSVPAATTLTTLYTVPGCTSTTVHTLTVCNRSGVATTFRISCAPKGAADAVAHYLYYDHAIAGKRDRSPERTRPQTHRRRPTPHLRRRSNAVVLSIWNRVLVNSFATVSCDSPRHRRRCCSAMDAKLPILIAEDNDDDIQILKYALKKAGLTNLVQICRDGEDVIHYLKAEDPYTDRGKFPFPRVMILDLKMPKVTGFDVLRWLRGHPDCSVIPCIVLSSSAEERDVIEAYRLGANAYFTKPGVLEALAEMFRLINQFWSAANLPPPVTKC